MLNNITNLLLLFLQSIRSDDNFKLFFEHSTKEAKTLDIEQPVLPRKRKIPRRFDSNNDSGTITATPEEYYRAIYLETLDNGDKLYQRQIRSDGYKIYCKLEMLLLKGDQEDRNYSHYDEVLELYQRDVVKDDFLVQLKMFHTNYNIDTGMNLYSIISLVKGMSAAERSIFSQIVKVVRLLLLVSATNAISEHSLSAM